VVTASVAAPGDTNPSDATAGSQVWYGLVVLLVVFSSLVDMCSKYLRKCKWTLCYDFIILRRN